MPTKPPHHVSSQLLRISHFLRILSRPTLILRDEPKKKHRPPQAGLHQFNPPVSPAGYPSLPRSIAHPPKNAKRTQFQHTQCPATPYLCETNPKNNRTPQACIHQYNPPVPPAGYPSLPRSIAHARKYAKRTQFPARRTKYKGLNAIKVDGHGPFISRYFQSRFRLR